MAKKGDNKKQLKEIYRQGTERITLALKMLGPVNTQTTAQLPNTEEANSFRILIKSIHDSLQFETNEEYRGPITLVTQWILNAYTHEYQESCANNSLSSLYAIRRCLEFLHLILYRDLRRNQKSPTESQAFFELQAFLAKFPNHAKYQTLQKSNSDSF